jgi:glycosyltransferase involved in cell wall biosynthesis
MPIYVKSIGDKRNDLLELSEGKFIVFIDDDDEVDTEYISLIINTIKSNEDIDCIGMKGIITFDGANERKWIISKQYGSWFERDNVYYRNSQSYFSR